FVNQQIAHRAVEVNADLPDKQTRSVHENPCNYGSVLSLHDPNASTAKHILCPACRNLRMTHDCTQMNTGFGIAPSLETSPGLFYSDYAIPQPGSRQLVPLI